MEDPETEGASLASSATRGMRHLHQVLEHFLETVEIRVLGWFVRATFSWPEGR